ncbi:MAG: hypothetical protein K5773_06195 [Pseudobutyrivibrio sp.]|nr:hypothetical protein [Pseudobutyrivibrio sp.]
MGTDYNDQEQEAVRKTFAGEKAKLAQMTTKEKFQYIWSYYKLHILVVLIIITAVVYIIHQRLTYVDYKLYGVVINSENYNESLMDTLPAELGMEKHEGFSYRGGLSAVPDSGVSGMYNQVDLFTISGQMDFAFTDDDGVQYLCNFGTPYDVTQVLPQELLDMWPDKEVSFTEYNPDTEQYYDNYAAINISGTAVQEYFGLDPSMCYLVITDLSDNPKYMDAFYQVLYDIETGKLK